MGSKLLVQVSWETRTTRGSVDVIDDIVPQDRGALAGTPGNFAEGHVLMTKPTSHTSKHA